MEQMISKMFSQSHHFWILTIVAMRYFIQSPHQGMEGSQPCEVMRMSQVHRLTEIWWNTTSSKVEMFQWNLMLERKKFLSWAVKEAICSISSFKKPKSPYISRLPRIMKGFQMVSTKMSVSFLKSEEHCIVVTFYITKFTQNCTGIVHRRTVQKSTKHGLLGPWTCQLSFKPGLRCRIECM